MSIFFCFECSVSQNLSQNWFNTLLCLQIILFALWQLNCIYACWHAHFCDLIKWERTASRKSMLFELLKWDCVVRFLYCYSLSKKSNCFTLQVHKLYFIWNSKMSGESKLMERYRKIFREGISIYIQIIKRHLRLIEVRFVCDLFNFIQKVPLYIQITHEFKNMLRKIWR